MFSRLARLNARLSSNRRGSVLVLMAFAIIPLTFAVGFGIDYARAMRLQTQLNAVADAAVLSAVAPAMILQPDSVASTAATSMFNSQASLQTGYQNLQLTINVSGSASAGQSGALGYLRKVTINYSAQSINLFGGILGLSTFPVSGTSSASAQQPPNVDFYLAMDNSPSMLLPATSDGISKIQNVTGCAFACHEQMPHNDSINVKNANGLQILLSSSYYSSGSLNQGVYYLYNPGSHVLYNSSGGAMNSSSTSGGVTTTTTYSIVDSTSKAVSIVMTTTSGGSSSQSTYDSGYWADGYWLTHNYGLLFGSPPNLILRKDDVVSAASQLIPFAANQAAQFNVTYQAQMFSFDWTRSGSTSPVKTLNNLTNVASYGSGFSVAPLFPADDYWWKNNQPTNSTSINDQATETTNMLTAMSNIIPTPGTGAPGSTPQKVLFIVTDGMLDQPNGSGRYFGPLQSSDLAQCTAIKARGIKIAILYTQYLPEALAGDAWSQSNVAPFLPPPPSPYSAGNAGTSDQVFTALQNCASPGTNGSPLVQTVTTSSNIATALQQLFSTALQTARLIK